MKKLFYIATVLLCSAYGSMQAQVVSPDGIAYSDLQVKKEGSLPPVLQPIFYCPIPTISRIVRPARNSLTALTLALS